MSKFLNLILFAIVEEFCKKEIIFIDIPRSLRILQMHDYFSQVFIVKVVT